MFQYLYWKCLENWNITTHKAGMLAFQRQCLLTFSLLVNGTFLNAETLEGNEKQMILYVKVKQN